MIFKYNLYRTVQTIEFKLLKTYNNINKYIFSFMARKYFKNFKYSRLTPEDS